MKNLSLFTFALFLVLLGVRLFSIQSDRYDEIGNIESNKDQEEKVSVFEMEPEKAKAILDDLDLYVKRSKEQERKVAQAKENSEKEQTSEVDLKSVKETIDKKYRELDEALLAQENNILDIKYMQDEIKRIKKDANMEFANSEIWSAEFILMLMMQEQFTLREVNELTGPEDLGIEMEEWVEMKEVAQSKDFKNKIKAFKGIAQDEGTFEEVTDYNIEDIEREEIDPYESGERNEAISEFMERNSRARQGENNDVIAVEPDEYNDGYNDYEDPYAQEDEPVRLPATLEEEEYKDEQGSGENNEEQEYQNYNDGYEDEY